MACCRLNVCVHNEFSAAVSSILKRLDNGGRGGLPYVQSYRDAID